MWREITPGSLASAARMGKWLALQVLVGNLEVGW
jgi:hypothetical protein